jgi:glyoxylase-like metal-dependent hydrolase (beta-lactamase superfamily II)
MQTMFRLPALTLGVSVMIALGACSGQNEEAAAPAAEAAPPAIAPVAASAEVSPFTIGEFQAAAITDGGMTVPNDNKILAVNAQKADVEALLTANGLPPDQLSLSIQPLLVKTTDKVLLFDTGAAGLMGPAGGKLPANLAAAGVDPASVTDIFISHAHGDHVGGLVANEALAFPNATIHIQAAEWASLQGQEQMAPLVAVITPKVAAFEPGADLVAGVKAVDIKGHTPGHAGYLITSGDQSLLYVGDMVHHSVISVQQPDWTIAFDGDAPTAQASRKEVIANAAASGQRVYAVHFPFPGLGKFEQQGDKYVWVAE